MAKICKLHRLFCILGILLLSACAAGTPTPQVISRTEPTALAETQVSAPTQTPIPPTSTATATVPPTVIPPRTRAPSPTSSPTPDPFSGLYVDDLAQRKYGGGELTVDKTLAVTNTFTRTLVSWQSDGLTIYG